MGIRSNGTIRLWGLLAALSSCYSLHLFSQNQTAPSPAAASLQPYGQCQAPTQEGVNICMPYQGAEVPSPFQVIAASTSGRGQVVSMELWADGKKLMQTAGTPFDVPITLPVGAHRLTLTEVDSTGSSSRSAPLNITVVDNPFSNQVCQPPGSPGVNVCQPPPSSCNPQPYTYISAAGKGQTGPVVRMEVWVSGTKVANFPGDHFETDMILFNAFYTMEIWEIDNHGRALKKALFLDGPC